MNVRYKKKNADGLHPQGVHKLRTVLREAGRLAGRQGLVKRVIPLPIPTPM